MFSSQSSCFCFNVFHLLFSALFQDNNLLIRNKLFVTKGLVIPRLHHFIVIIRSSWYDSIRVKKNTTWVYEDDRMYFNGIRWTSFTRLPFQFNCIRVLNRVYRIDMIHFSHKEHEVVNNLFIQSILFHRRCFTTSSLFTRSVLHFTERSRF